jgi:galactose-1-phosphate uridylyltransferase
MRDGTIKQINPSTGTRVWTVPGRGSRPQTQTTGETRPVSDTDWTHGCAFCSARYLETPPEKARLIRNGDDWQTLEHVPAERLFDTVAEFRAVPNLFEIVSYNYWHDNYGYVLPAPIAAHKRAYLASDQGRRHVCAVQGAKMRLLGTPAEDIASLEQDQMLCHADGFFGGSHDVVIARRHWVDGARTTTDLASAGTLTPDEHEQYIRLTLHAMENLYTTNRYVRYVAAFQNWLKPAGASFDHLHKQLVAIDEHGANADQVLSRVRENLNFFNECGVNYASYHNLLVAENASAIAFAGFGHRYPAIEIYSKSAKVRPWEHSSEEVRDISDLMHAIHAATGPDVPCNEEWHHVPVDVDVPMPWRINIKWRVSTVAGFEGDTKIYINTISPHEVHESVTKRLYELRAAGAIADIRIADECSGAPNPLKYNPSLW